MALLNFDASQHAPDEGRAASELMPIGWYNALIEHSEVKPTKSGDGQYLSLRFKIMDGPYAGQCVWHMLNLWNKNPQAVQIASGQLSAIAAAVGIVQVVQSEQLHAVPMKINLDLDESAGYKPKNKITSFKHITHPVAVVTERAAVAMAAVASPLGALAVPQASQYVAAPPMVHAPSVPQVPQAPAVPQVPQAPVYGAPVAPQVPQAPAAPVVPTAAPVAPAAPAAPAVQPDWAAAPAQPWAGQTAAPATPTQAAPAAPVAPQVAETPAVQEAQAAVPPWVGAQPQ